MQMSKSLYLAFLLVTLLAAGCAHMQPFEVQPADQIPPGPGLFSGDDGEFVIFRR
jgi:hypothetical protein